HLVDIGRNRTGQERPSQGTEHLHHPGSGRQYRRQVLLLAEILVQVSGDLLLALQDGKDIHETEEAGPELLVPQTPVDHPAGPGAAAENGRLFAGNGGKKRPAAGNDPLVQIGGLHHSIRLPNRDAARSAASRAVRLFRSRTGFISTISMPQQQPQSAMSSIISW